MKVKEKVIADFRTVPLRVIHGTKIGRAALNNLDLPIEFIRDIFFSAASMRAVLPNFIHRIDVSTLI